MSEPRLQVEVAGVPYNSSGRAGGVAAAPAALRGAGLTGVVQHLELIDDGDIELRMPAEVDRGRSGLLAESLLADMFAAVRDRTISALNCGRFPLLIGGDCPVLLGGLSALKRQVGNAGVLFVDGHEDAWPPAVSPTGEAADSELGLALGLHGFNLPAGLADDLPLLTADSVVVVGPRDQQELRDSDVDSIASLLALSRPEAVHTAMANGVLDLWVHGRIALLQAAAPRWWFHVDLDVLSSDQLQAVDYPQPGGLTWAELDIITTAALASDGCSGWSVCIYNPDLDPCGTDAGRIVDYLSIGLSQLTDRLPMDLVSLEKSERSP